MKSGSISKMENTGRPPQPKSAIKAPQDDLSAKLANKDTRLLLIDTTIPLSPIKPREPKIKEIDPLLPDLFTSMLFPDVTFMVHGQKFQAHKGILAIASDYFAKLFEEKDDGSGDLEIEIKHVSSATFRTILEYIYRKDVSLTAELALDLLKVSKGFSLEGLRRISGEYLIVKLTLDTFVQVAKAVDQNSIKNLRPDVLSFMVRNLTDLRQRKDFYETPVSFLVEVLDLLKPKEPN